MKANMQFLSFWVWVTSLKDYSQFHLFTCKFHCFIFNSWIIFHRVSIAHFHYAFISWCTSKLFSFSRNSCYEQSSNEHEQAIALFPPPPVFKTGFLCSFGGWPGTSSCRPDIPASASWVLELKVCTTITWLRAGIFIVRDIYSFGFCPALV